MEVFKWNTPSWKAMRINLYSNLPVVRGTIRVRLIVEGSGVAGTYSLKPLKSKGLFYVTGNACATSSSINRAERQQPFSYDFFLLWKTIHQQNFYVLMSLQVGTFAGIKCTRIVISIWLRAEELYVIFTLQLNQMQILKLSHGMTV